MPGPVSGGCGHWGRLVLEERLTEATLEVLAGEAPGERLLGRRVALAEREDTPDEFVQRGAVVRSQHLALDDREVQLDLVEPTRMGGRVDQDDARMARPEFLGGALAPM